MSFRGPEAHGDRVPTTGTLRYQLDLPRPLRRKHGFAITAWVFLPDHGHAIIDPPYPLTISTVFKAVKVSSMIDINVRREEIVPSTFSGGLADSRGNGEGKWREMGSGPFSGKNG